MRTVLCNLETLCNICIASISSQHHVNSGSSPTGSQKKLRSRGVTSFTNLPTLNRHNVLHWVLEYTNYRKDRTVSCTEPTSWTVISSNHWIQPLMNFPKIAMAHWARKRKNKKFLSKSKKSSSDPGRRWELESPWYIVSQLYLSVKHAKYANWHRDLSVYCLLHRGFSMVLFEFPWWAFGCGFNLYIALLNAIVLTTVHPVLLAQRRTTWTCEQGA